MRAPERAAAMPLPDQGAELDGSRETNWEDMKKNPELAKSIVDAWLRSDFDGGRSQPKVDLIQAYEGSH